MSEEWVSDAIGMILGAGAIEGESTIRAGSVVLHDAAENSIVAGNPAVPIRKGVLGRAKHVEHAF